LSKRQQYGLELQKQARLQQEAKQREKMERLGIHIPANNMQGGPASPPPAYGAGTENNLLLFNATLQFLFLVPESAPK
jgi:hypothetical protein